ncbi:MAG TPA: hypothetical protein VLC53_11440, partial [Myxococcota bacterium]|nr:hypothetical protein [Myxococcota bacterium]
PEVVDGAGAVVPVDLYVQCCPPHPFNIFDGLLGMLDRLEPRRGSRAVPAAPPPAEGGPAV